jgi:hypothetical protein
MKMTQFSSLFAIIAVTSVAQAYAGQGELNPAPAQVPAGIIVQVDAQGNAQVFQNNDSTVVSDAATAQAQVAAQVTPANQIANVLPVSELDRTSSNEAWYSWYNPGYYPYYSYYYGYNYYGYTYTYAPYYSYYYGGYYYHYYRRW